MTHESRWNEARRIIGDSTVRTQALLTFSVLVCAGTLQVLAFAVPSPLSWYLAGFLGGFAFMSLVLLGGVVVNSRRMRDARASGRAAAAIIANYVIEELEGRGFDVEVTAGPDGIAVRKRDPATSVH